MREIINNRIFGLLAVSASLSVLSTHQGCNGSGSKQDAADTLTSEQVLNEVQSIRAVGKVVPAYGWKVVSSPVTARVKRILVQEGDRVQAEDVLLELEDQQAVLDVQEARARLRTAQADQQSIKEDLRKAQVMEQELKDRFLTSQRLLQAGAETRETYRTDSSAWAQQQIQIRNLEQKQKVQTLQLEEQRIQLAKRESQKADFQIRATESGVLVDLQVEHGESISATTEIAKIVDPTQVLIEAEVDELFANSVSKGQRVSLFSIGRPDCVGEGQILWVSPILSDKSILYETANEAQDRRVRKIKIQVDAASASTTGLAINSKVECEIKLK